MAGADVLLVLNFVVYEQKFIVCQTSHANAIKTSQCQSASVESLRVNNLFDMTTLAAGRKQKSPELYFVVR